MQINSAVVLGSDPAGLTMAMALCRAGVATTLVEPDPHDALRVAHFLHRMSVAAQPALAPVVVPELPKDGFPDLAFDAGAGFPADMLDRAGSGPLVLAADAVSGDRQVLGLHLVPPAHLRDLLEITCPGSMPARTQQAVRDLAARMGKAVLWLSPGQRSVISRLRGRLTETADFLLMDGATPWDLDEAMTEFGYDLGVYQTEDLIGLDASYADRQRALPSRNPNRRYVPIADRMVQEGRLGQQVGVGWYRYPGGGGPVIDPLVEDLIREEARFAHVTPRPISAVDVQHSLLLALIHEGMQMLAGGAAPDAATIDRACVAGLGFPQALGGPLQSADDMGLQALDRELARLHQTSPVVWPVCRVLQDCLDTGTPIRNWTPRRP